MACLDDVYVVCAPHRVRADTDRGRGTVPSRHISVHHGKCGTLVERAAQSVDRAPQSIDRAAQSVDPTAVVWKSDPRWPLNERGLWVSGCPIGSPEYVGSCRRSSGGMGVVVPLRSHQGQFLVAQRSTCTDFLVCPAARRQRVFSGLTGFSNESPEARLTSSAPLGKGARSVERSSHQRSCPLGKLGGQWSPCSSMSDLSWKRRGPNAAEKKGVSQVEEHHLQTVVWPTLSDEGALWRSLIRVHCLLRSSASIAHHFPQLPMWPSP